MKKSILIKRIKAHTGEIKLRVHAAIDDMSILVPVSKRAIISQFDHLAGDDNTGIRFENGTLSSDEDEHYRDANGDIDPMLY